jgi:hypothetical protein
MGWTALHIAVAKGTVETVKTLIAAGADLNATGPQGWGVLHLACNLGRKDFVEVGSSQTGLYFNHLRVWLTYFNYLHV